MRALAGFLRGVGLLFQGFRLWSVRPDLMLLGLVPAALVGLVVLTALIVLAINLDALVVAATPFADDWDPAWSSLLRLLASAAVFVGAVLLAAVTFTGIALAVGDPVYERVWRATETALGGEAPAEDLGFWSAVRDSTVLILLGALVAVLGFALGFVPVVGGVLGFVVGTALSGRLLARELVSRAFQARGLDAAARARLVPGHRLELLGFGVATQLCFLVPLGAILMMPVAVSGATILARRMLAGPGTPPGGRPGPQPGGRPLPQPGTQPAAPPPTR